MAVRITDKTYPVAIACLGPEVALIPKEKVVGNYLVINKTVVITDKDGVGYTAITNDWCDESEFFAQFKFINQEAKFTFAEVKSIA